MQLNHLKTKVLVLFLLSLTAAWLSVFPSFAASLPEPPNVEEITLYNWQGDIPESLLDAFTRETKIKIEYQVFTSQEEAVANIEAGKIYDVVVIDGRFISQLRQQGLLQPLNYENLLNFKYISPNFRGLTYDPDNRYCIPYSWGTTGLLVNRSIQQAPVQKWADLWEERNIGKIAISASYPREAIGMTLKSLGYSANSEDPSQIQAAVAKLLALRIDPSFLYRFYPEFGIETMKSGKIAIAVGFSGDVLESQNMNLAVEYILPKEGLLLWADTFVIPKSSKKQASAELFINFILRPEISAEIVNRKYYASANEAARPYIEPQILENIAIYPTDSMLLTAEIIEAISPEGQRLFDAGWQRYLAAYPKPQ